MSPDLQWNIVVVATVVLATIWIVVRLRRLQRRRRPPKIHPQLQKYQPASDVGAERRREAEKIIATSSTTEVAGYRVVRQIEAVFVDGLRWPEEAVAGLKAVAAMKGANGVINVRHAPSSTGKYSASGDAVVLEPIGDEVE